MLQPKSTHLGSCFERPVSLGSLREPFQSAPISRSDHRLSIGLPDTRSTTLLCVATFRYFARSGDQSPAATPGVPLVDAERQASKPVASAEGISAACNEVPPVVRHPVAFFFQPYPYSGAGADSQKPWPPRRPAADRSCAGMSLCHCQRVIGLFVRGKDGQCRESECRGAINHVPRSALMGIDRVELLTASTGHRFWGGCGSAGLHFSTQSWEPRSASGGTANYIG